MRVIRAGARALLVECEDQEQVFLLYAQLRRDTKFVEVVPGDRTLMVVADRAIDEAELRREIQLTPGGPARAAAEPLVVEVRYDGPDLARVADLTGNTVEEVVAAHTGSPWTAQFLGFSPGFAYLTNENAGLDVPRNPSPRTRVPAGSVALGARYSAVYPMATPGGWRLIGSTDAPLWDPERDPPPLISPGSLVRFVAA